MSKSSKSLMESLSEAGYPKEKMYHHCSDLYVFVNAVTEKVTSEWYKENVISISQRTKFKDNITGRMMFDYYFQYIPFW